MSAFLVQLFYHVAARPLVEQKSWALVEQFRLRKTLKLLLVRQTSPRGSAADPSSTNRRQLPPSPGIGAQDPRTVKLAGIYNFELDMANAKAQKLKAAADEAENSLNSQDPLRLRAKAAAHAAELQKARAEASRLEDEKKRAALALLDVANELHTAAGKATARRQEIQADVEEQRRRLDEISGLVAALQESDTLGRGLGLSTGLDMDESSGTAEELAEAKKQLAAQEAARRLQAEHVGLSWSIPASERRLHEAKDQQQQLEAKVVDGMRFLSLLALLIS